MPEGDVGGGGEGGRSVTMSDVLCYNALFLAAGGGRGRDQANSEQRRKEREQQEKS